MSKLSSSFAEKGQLLYHAMPWAPRGDAITPSDKYGATISPAARKKLGMPDGEQTPLLFASTELNKALPYTIPKGNGKFFNATIDAADTEILVAYDRDKFMSQPLNGTVFSLPADGFLVLPEFQHQGASTKPVPFDKTKVVLKAHSMEDLMRAGLQIFTFSESNIYGDAPAEKLYNTTESVDTMDQLSGLIKSGRVIWENQARGLNPNAKLAQMMGIALPTSRPQHVPKPRF